MPPNSDQMIVPAHAANTISDSGRIHGARSFESTKPSDAGAEHGRRRAGERLRQRVRVDVAK